MIIICLQNKSSEAVDQFRRVKQAYEVTDFMYSIYLAATLLAVITYHSLIRHRHYLSQIKVEYIIYSEKMESRGLSIV